MAILFGCQKFFDYIFGKTVEVHTDHKPLETIAKRSLYKVPKRLQRILLSLKAYDLKVVWRPGSQMYIADQLSRAYLKLG